MSKFSILYIDVPRFYNNRHDVRKDNPDKKSKFGLGVNTRYPLGTMDNKKLELLPLLSVAEDNCALFSWSTCPNLPDDIKLLEAWNFRYVTVAFVWVKTYQSGQIFFGPGSYSGSNAELCLLAMRGSLPRNPLSCSQIIHEEISPEILLTPHPRTPENKIWHSAKPPIVRDHIVSIFGDLPRLEIFARTLTPGWESLGYEIDQKDIWDSLPALAAMPQVGPTPVNKLTYSTGSLILKG